MTMKLENNLSLVYKFFLHRPRNISAYLLCFVMAFIVSPKVSGSDKLPAPFSVIPQPTKVKLLKEPGLEFDNLEGITLSGFFKSPVLGENLSGLAIKKNKSQKTLTLILDSTLTSIPNDEGYILTISEKKTEILAKGEAGLFYGCQTLEQLLEDAQQYHKSIPSCVITDYPELSYRSVHFDVKHHLDHLNYYYQSIDRLARYKINAVIFEFEDKLRYQRQPLVGAPQSISIDEMAALTRYACERHIDISPLVQGLGHATFILKHEEYAHLRELSWNRWAFCPLHEGSYQVLFDLYRDAMEATPGSKFLHVGGDEVGNIGLCPRCKPTADKEGILSLNLYWLNRVCEFAEAHGRTPIFWDDMPLHHAGLSQTNYSNHLTNEQAAKLWDEGRPNLDKLLEKFPKNCIYMRWYYWVAGLEHNSFALDWYKEHGLKVLVAPATNLHGGVLFQEEEREKGAESVGLMPVQKLIQLGAEEEVEGVLCTAWDDSSPHMENYWHGFIASAEYSWSPNGRTLGELDQAWLQKEFGLSIPDYLSFNRKLWKGSDLWYKAYYKDGARKDFWNSLQALINLEQLPEPGESPFLSVDYAKILIDLPDLDSPGAWSEEHRDLLDKCDVELDNYLELSQRLQAYYNGSTKNRYYWELSKALYELQMTAPRLLLALKKVDTSPRKQMGDGIKQVHLALENFDIVWEDLKVVFSKTRFVSYPSNYVPDRYRHPASQREDLTWMIQAEEKYHKMIKEWIQF